MLRLAKHLLPAVLPALLLGACADPPTIPPSSTPPPSWGVPVSGGTMHVSSDGTRAIVADPDRDRVLLIDLATDNVTEIALETNDEPGRVIEDAAGRFHVALRRGGAVITIDPATASITARRAICAEPRGLAYDPGSDSIHVACTSGELVTLPAAGGDVTRRLRLDRDLRDVIVQNGALYVSRFRKAELIKLDASGAEVSRVRSPDVNRIDFSNDFASDPNGTGDVPAIAAVAWRTVGLPDGSILMLHQRQLDKQLGTQQTGGYGGGCGGTGGPVEAAMTVVGPTGVPLALAPAFFGALPVDLAVNRTGDTFAVVLAGSHEVHQVRSRVVAHEDQNDCPFPDGQDDAAPMINDDLGTPTSVDYTPDGSLVVFYPEVPAIVTHPQAGTAHTLMLPGPFGYDSGRAMFHQQTPVGIACASCHPEGREDGLVWKFEFGARRTQSIAGGILARAPYHWAGDEADLQKLMNDVFAIRMAAGTPSHSQLVSLGPWLDRVPAPAPAPALDQAAADRGKAIFESAETQCVTCHNGALLTNNQRVAVGTGGTFKVPSLLGVGARAPFIHDGCAATLADRFGGTCGGADQHGHTSQLDPQQLSDLVAYLDTL